MHAMSSPSSCCLEQAPAPTKGTLKKKGGRLKTSTRPPNTRQPGQNPPAATRRWTRHPPSPPGGKMARAVNGKPSFATSRTMRARRAWGYPGAGRFACQKRTVTTQKVSTLAKPESNFAGLWDTMHISCLRAERVSRPDPQAPTGCHQVLTQAPPGTFLCEDVASCACCHHPAAPTPGTPWGSPNRPGSSHVRAFGSARQPRLESDSEPQGGREEEVKTRGPPTGPRLSLSHVSGRPGSPRPAPAFSVATVGVTRSLPPPKRNASTHSGRRRAQEVRAPVPILKDAVPGDMEAGRGAART